MLFSIGADPEVFVGVNNKFTSAHNLVTGTKAKPHRLIEGAVQVDGMALEYNIDPCSTKQEFVHRIEYVKKQMEDMVPGYEILKTTSVNFTQDDVAEVPNRFFMLGCSVDFNAYTGRPNEKPSSSEMMRTAGGHVHIGGFPSESKFNKEHYSKCIQLSKLMDKELGIYSLLWDNDVKRRSMYGKAGCFRPTTYGVEYRTLSNLWIFNKDLIEFVYDSTRRAYDKFFEGERVDTNFYQKVINNSVLEEVPDDYNSKLVREIINEVS